MKVTCYNKQGNVVDPATMKVPKEIAMQLSNYLNGLNGVRK